MKLLHCSVLLVLVASAMCKGGGGPMKIIDMLLGPPKTIDECLDRMKMKMDMKMEMIEGMHDIKWGCKGECLSEEQMKCMPDEAFREKVKEEGMNLKKEFLEVKDKARECIKSKIGNGCSKTPIRWGMCGMGIVKKLLGREVKMCMGDCMMEKMKDRMKDAIMKMAETPGFPSVAEIMEMKAAFKGRKGGMYRGGMGMHGGKRRMMKKMKGMMGGKMMGLCITHFCEIDTLMECAVSSGLQDMYKKKKAVKLNILKMMEEAMFPNICSCLKKTARNLPEYLESFNCENKPNVEVCSIMHKEFMDRKMKEMKEAQITARKKREVSNLFNMNEEMDELEELDEFDLE